MDTLRTIATTTARLLGPVVLALCLAVLGVLAVGPLTGRYQAATVLSASMRPTMPEGSMVLTTPADPADLRVGDVITYRIPVEDRRLVTHRVVEIVRPGATPVVRTKGDANDSPDPWTARLTGGSVWKARIAVPGAGYAALWLRHPVARTLFVLFVPIVLAALWLKDIWAGGDKIPVPVPTDAHRPGGHATVAVLALLSLGALTVRQRA